MVTVTPAYFLPYLEVGNQDQVAMLQILLQWVYPNGRSHCSNPKAIEAEASTEATNELPNMSLDSEVIETEAPKNDMITVDFENSRHKTKLQNKGLEDVQGEYATNVSS